eukprot:CAMPEP_0194275138 /NCGR_PEP_ID=MMETSP0169-20130528/8059_1 /TAXON_ID=218684 /ORGANISM="Corethron pennatum, Strain L29A3" /LENGTH=372 /DNA_ID=CAMNT_0039018531 /DNA_START=41 /DNA_END=1159 /DNA_ORIENTATION=+
MSTPTDTTRPDPAALFASTSMAQTLTISDQHATILLSSPSAERSLLKLTLVPFHKTELLGPTRSTAASSDGTEQKAAEKEHSVHILRFLSRFDWRVTSESGAEYTYFEASPKVPAPPPKKARAEDGGSGGGTNVPSFKVELISPASDRQVARAMPSPGLAMVAETPDLYRRVTRPHIDGIVAGGSLAWLKNVVSGEKERERLLVDGTGWILNIDTKWRSHPDARTTPRRDWLGHVSTADLYCLGILKTDGIASVRDLSAAHLPVLREMLEEGPRAIQQTYGVAPDQLRVFVHYPPQFYHLHVHYTRLENDTGAQVERGILLADIIQNLEMDEDYYRKRTMTFKLSLKDKLYKLFDAEKTQEGGEVAKEGQTN